MFVLHIPKCLESTFPHMWNLSLLVSVWKVKRAKSTMNEQNRTKAIANKWFISNHISSHSYMGREWVQTNKFEQPPCQSRHIDLRDMCAVLRDWLLNKVTFCCLDNGNSFISHPFYSTNYYKIEYKNSCSMRIPFTNRRRALAPINQRLMKCIIVIYESFWLIFSTSHSRVIIIAYNVHCSSSSNTHTHTHYIQAANYVGGFCYTAARNREKIISLDKNRTAHFRTSPMQLLYIVAHCVCSKHFPLDLFPALSRCWKIESIGISIIRINETNKH